MTISAPHPSQTMNNPAPLWVAAADVENCNMAIFARFAQTRGGPNISTYDTQGFQALHRWSIEHSSDFWSCVWDFFQVAGARGDKEIIPLDQAPWARFYPNGEINYTENIFAHAPQDETRAAVITRRQDEPSITFSWADLRANVSIWEQALLRAGLAKGDRIAVYLPNIAETIFIFLAAANHGIVFSSAGMEMGTADLINRLTQIQPKILITADGYVHGPKTIDRMPVIAQAAREITGLEKIVVLGLATKQPNLSDVIHSCSVDSFLKDITPRALTFVRRNFNHPLYILFSSGSTGKPKCFEHSTGGILLKHLVEIGLHADVKAGDRLFYHATPSWMMWNWLASGLAVGATILLYDGSPTFPNIQTQWDFTAEHACTHHGNAAPVILGWQSAHLDISQRTDLEPCRMLIYTGAVLPAHGFDYVHRSIKNTIKIAPISGGTDIVGSFLAGNPFMPTYAGQINGPVLGMDIDVWDDDGKPCPPLQAGEMVCKNAFPSMPLRFLDDDGGMRYAAEYFDTYPGKKIWRHGDSIERTIFNQFVIIGRSDATLNQNGVRIGTGAIYDQLVAFHDVIDDYAAVDFTRPDNKQAITILFLVLKNDAPDVPEPLQAAIRKTIKDNVTPYAIPTEIFSAPAILKTPNGKKAEVVIKKAINGKSIPNPTLYGVDYVEFYLEIGRKLDKKYTS
jgi:acetoacetyl-CoA synthetase